MSASLRSFALTRRFWPLLITHMLGAFNDNFFKNALVILLLYRLADAGSGPLLVTAAAGLFILPYILLSALGGALADSMEKAGLMRKLKALEIAVMSLGAAGFALGSIPLLLMALFLMGAQSALFSPVKYAILPEHLHREELIGGNALMEGGVYLAILLGTIAGGLLVMAGNGPHLVGGAAIAIAIAGTLTSLLIPRSPVPVGGSTEGGSRPARPSLNLFTGTARVLKASTEDRKLFYAILAIGWFHFTGALYLAQFPNYARTMLGASEEVVTLMLATFSIGIAVGAAGCQALLKGRITLMLLPWAAAGIALPGVDLYFASPAMAIAGVDTLSPEALTGAAAFLESPANWRILGDLFLLSAAGGVFIVPLYAVIQAGSKPENRARILAASNIFNALFVVLSSALAAALLALELNPAELFLVAGLTSCGVTIMALFSLSNRLIKGFLALLLRRLYRVEVSGLEHVRNSPAGSLLVANHVSYLDGALLGAVLPEEPVFVVNLFTAQKWWAKPFLALIRALKVDPVSPWAARQMIRTAQEGQRIVVFPEGRITVTGGLMKLYEGTGTVADKAGVPVVPVHIDGLERSKFSRMKGKWRLSWFPKVRITILPPRTLEVPEEVKGRQRRQALVRALETVMEDAALAARPRHRTLFDALLDARTRDGGDSLAVEDAERTRLTYDRLVTGSRLLGRLLARESVPGEHVGVLLPNMAGSLVTFFALQAAGRVPAMLNFSAGPETIAASCRTGKVSLVLTSRRFVEKARLQKTIDALEANGQHILWLDDLRARISTLDRLGGLLRTRLAPRSWQPLYSRRNRPDPDQSPAVILFTSGSEGNPKGVALSHDNILANCAQLSIRVDYTPRDKVLNALPLFHAFGLVGGTLLPVTNGVPVCLYPSPLHYRMVPEIAYDSAATIMFGTDSFLFGYGRVANPSDFRFMRLVFAGAEKVKDETRRLWAEKFGIRLLEGYGATETGPVLAVNAPRHARFGTVGRPLTGVETRLEPVEGIENGGKLLVRGPNIMLGYLGSEQASGTGKDPEGWYDTGDIATLEPDGHLVLQARLKRFAKIAGEMVSLPLVEDLAARICPGIRHAAITIPVTGRGEQLCLLSEDRQLNRASFLEKVRDAGLSELLVPKRFDLIEKMPLLPGGKVDYRNLEQMLAAS